MCHYLWIDNLLDYTFHNAQDTRQGEVMELSANHKRKGPPTWNWKFIYCYKSIRYS